MQTTKNTWPENAKDWAWLFDWFHIVVFNTTFNNISVISWWLILLVEETRVLGENHQPATSYW